MKVNGLFRGESTDKRKLYGIVSFDDGGVWIIVTQPESASEPWGTEQERVAALFDFAYEADIRRATDSKTT